MNTLYLIPNRLGDTELSCVLPADVVAIIKQIKVFATESQRNTRRFLKQIDRDICIDELVFLDLNEHSTHTEVVSYLSWLEKGDVGVISEAGCPGIADPGAELVALAHQHDYKVVPLVGPSSILLALIASGCNGQTFSFNGYLPINSHDRIKALRMYEKQSAVENRTQIFIETPYRNVKLFQDMLSCLSSKSLLSVSCDITTHNEYIKTLPIYKWKQQATPDIDKRPTIFIVYAGS
ncbi:S-adenosylmethionine-dependent methyltransferase [Bacteroidia bacterium]|nr:S-adenosylmethionine-dependent methyltransferase [Bacteroidia bacterium]